jgi:uncharacterized RDD family membrane protein YckC
MQVILEDLDYKPVLAYIPKRWLASFIDFLLVILVCAIVTVIFGKRVINEDGSPGGWSFGGIGGNISLFLSWLLFLPGIEAFNNGQTIGKVLMRIRTIKEDGSPLGFGRSLLKHVFDIIDHLPGMGILGLTVAAINKKRKRIGDLVARTIVVDSRS